MREKERERSLFLHRCHAMQCDSITVTTEKNTYEKNSSRINHCDKLTETYKSDYQGLRMLECKCAQRTYARALIACKKCSALIVCYTHERTMPVSRHLKRMKRKPITNCVCVCVYADELQPCFDYNRFFGSG